MSATTAGRLRIGELAELTGTTPRTIRYYEEIGLLPGGEREQGKHRSYGEEDVERVQEIIRLRSLLGLSLDELSTLLEAQAARADLRRRFQETDGEGKRRLILEQALGHIQTQLGLVRGRRNELEKLEQELLEKRRAVRGALRDIDR
jgi:MerR family transcriptional regulator, repressor of the yfmOP operon